MKKRIPILPVFGILLMILSCSKNDTIPSPVNCDGLVTDTLGTNDNGRIYIANAFTSNNDGINDICAPVAMNISAIKFTVYDENNAIVYTTTQIGSGWSPASTNKSFTKYYYSIQATTISNHQIGKCGEVYNILCFPSNVSPDQFFFPDQLTPFGYTGVTQEKLVHCP